MIKNVHFNVDIYTDRTVNKILIVKFQNISCYCLTYNIGVWLYYLVISKHLMLLFNLHALWQFGLIANFKTSHVIV